MPQRFSEFSTVYSKTHEVIAVEILHRLIRDGESSFGQRSVNSHVTHIVQDAHMDSLLHPRPGDVAWDGFCGIGPGIVNPEFHPRRHQTHRAAEQGPNAAGIALSDIGIEIRFELRSRALQRLAGLIAQIVAIAAAWNRPRDADHQLLLADQTAEFEPAGHA